MTRHIRTLLQANILGDEFLTCLKIIEKFSIHHYNVQALSKFVATQHKVLESEILILKLENKILVYESSTVYLAFIIELGTHIIYDVLPCDDFDLMSDLMSGECIVSKEDARYIPLGFCELDDFTL